MSRTPSLRSVAVFVAGRALRFATADFIRVENGKFAEHWDVVDSLPRAIALGLVPPPKAPTRIAPK